MGAANMVRWIALDPNICLNESDSKLYADFKYFEILIIKI